MNVKRQAVIDQNYCCAFCHKPFSAVDVLCYNKRFSVVVCRPCNIPVVQLGAAVDRFGGTEAYFAILTRFMATVDKPDDESVNNATQALTGTTPERLQP